MCRATLAHLNQLTGLAPAQWQLYTDATGVTRSNAVHAEKDTLIVGEKAILSRFTLTVGHDVAK